jgi:hypothetical protein
MDPRKHVFGLPLMALYPAVMEISVQSHVGGLFEGLGSQDEAGGRLSWCASQRQPY